MSVTIKKESNEIRIKSVYIKTEKQAVAEMRAIEKKLPNRPDNSAQCWIDWEGDGCWDGAVTIYIFLPINEYAKYLKDIKSEIGEGFYKTTLEEIKLKLEGVKK